ncbi:hypothetical protein MIM_c33290 [Advenella mimigardefordensis DPN7]|uniref:Uncharacterized protein n=2 Tax=Advenella mimigardefordensis TaxID=302406 RepID=W0PIQ1_ADVMD|nr:hypothetical protein MIM_c33290 [Advenella mimigardefordensis DPN7]
MGTHETELSKAIFGAERNRRVATVNYARASVGLEKFTLNATNEEHVQRFISGDSELLCIFAMARNISTTAKALVPPP